MMGRGYRYRVLPPLVTSSGAISLGATSANLSGTTHALLGRVCEQGPVVPVRLSFDRECVLAIFGQRGSGKSFTLGVILEALGCGSDTSEIGRNIGDRSVLVFDTLNIYQHSTVPVSAIPDETIREAMILNLQQYGLSEVSVSFDVSYPAGHRLDFYPQEYTPLEVDTSLIRPEDYAHIFELDLYRDPMGQALLTAEDLVKDVGYSKNGKLVPANKNAGLAELIDCLTHDPTLEQTFQTGTRRSLLARLQSLFRMTLFSGRGTPLASLLQAGRVRILLLGQLSPELRSVVAGLVMRQVFNARATAAEASKALKLQGNLTAINRAQAQAIVDRSPPRTLICIDEAQGYAPPSKANPSTGIIIQYVKEGRNHGLSLALTSQQPAAIHNEVLSQVDVLIAHRLTVPSDVEAAMCSSKGRAPDKISSSQQVLSETDVLRELVQGQAWMSHGDASRAFPIEVRPRVTAHGGIEG